MYDKLPRIGGLLRNQDIHTLNPNYFSRTDQGYNVSSLLLNDSVVAS